MSTSRKRSARIVLIMLAVILAAGGLLGVHAEKVLVIAQAGDIATLDKQFMIGPGNNAVINIDDWQWLGFTTVEGSSGQLFSGPSTDLAPQIISSWETEERPDGTAVHTLHILPGQVFHSGNPITAEDFKYVLLRRAAAGRDWVHIFFGGMYSYDEGLEDHLKVIDDYTLEVEVKRSTPLFFNIWAQRTYFDSALLKANATEDDPWAKEFAAKNDHGSGPFELESWTQGVEMVMTRFDEYWGPAPALDKIIWRTVPDTSSRLMLLQSGAVDIALNLPARELDALENAPGVKVISGPSTNQLFIGMNMDVPPFDNENLRWALTYAFPYDDVIPAIFSGEARPNFGPVPTGIEGALTERRFETDLDLARAYLVKAGYGDGITLPLTYEETAPAHELIGILFKENLRSIGVDLQLRQLPGGQFQTGTKERTIGFFFYEGLGWIQSAEYNINMNFADYSIANVTGYANSAVLGLLEKALVEVDDAKRISMNSAMQEIILSEAAWIYVCQPNFRLAMREDVTGYVVQNTELHHLWLLDKPEE